MEEKSKTLKEKLPPEFIGGEYRNTKAFQMRDIIVTKEHCYLWDGDNYIKWPGSHKNVNSWVELENGYIVGWNENPLRGWSFPVLKINSQR